MGSGAINGSPSNYRNFFDENTKKEIEFFLKKFNHREKVSGIGEIVKVDDTIPGCPIIEDMFKKVLEKYLVKFGVKHA